MHLSEEQQRQALRVAAGVIRGALGGPPYVEPLDLDPSLAQPAGCFVSLHDGRSHALRGCIGTMDASRPLIRALVHAAEAVLDDPRFGSMPVTLGELPALTIEVSALSPLRPASSPLDFDLLNDGIYLTYAGRTGVFLPQVARETGWSKEQLLDRLCTEKMGLPPIAWRSPEARLQTFSTLIIGPVQFTDALS